MEKSGGGVEAQSSELVNERREDGVKKPNEPLVGEKAEHDRHEINQLSISVHLTGLSPQAI